VKKKKKGQRQEKINGRARTLERKKKAGLVSPILKDRRCEHVEYTLFSHLTGKGSDQGRNFNEESEAT